MYKILVFVSLIHLIFVIDIHGQSIDFDQMKTWQLKGYGKHADKINDTYTGILIYQNLVKRKPQNLKFRWELGFQAKKARDYKLAYKVFGKLEDLDKKNSRKASYHKAVSAMSNQQHEEAIELFDSINSLKKDKVFQRNYELKIENHLNGCYLIQSYQDSIPFMFLDRLDYPINNAHMELSPIFINDSNFVYGTSGVNTLEYYTDQEDFPKRKYFTAFLKNQKWFGGGAAQKPFNFMTEYDAGASAFSLDKQRLYFTVCRKNWKGETISNIYVSTLKNNVWQSPKKLGHGINLQMYSSSEPAVGTCYDPRLEVVYFVSDRPGGHGGTDIWFTTYDKSKNSYQKPVNAGIFLNTSGDEASPFYDIHNHRIYFSSDGHITMGGLDVLYSMGEMVSWDEPINMGVPINSSYDDLFFTKNEVGNKGFITSNRPGGNPLTHETCCDDIFAWKAASTEKIWVEGKLVEEQYKINSLLKGEKEKALNAPLEKMQALDNAKIKVFIKRGEQRGDFVKDYRTDSLGSFKILLNKGLDYELVIDDKRVLDKKIDLNKLSNNIEDLSVKIEPIAIETVSEQPIILENIYYGFNDSKLREDSKQILNNTLLRLMKEYPELLVEIRSHTDNKGSAKFNLRLSEHRSKSVVEYLVAQGINPNRLKSVGFGETIPIAQNTLENGKDNPEGRAANRRTEFRLVDSEEINN